MQSKICYHLVYIKYAACYYSIKRSAFYLLVDTPNRRLVLATFFFVLLATSLSRVQVYLVKLITDTAILIEEQPEFVSDLWFWMLLLPGLYLVNENVWRCSGFCGMRAVTSTGAHIYEKLFAYLTGHSAEYFSDRYAGALSNKISNASQGVEQIMMQVFWQFSPLTIGLLGDLFVTGLAHWYFSLALGLFICLYILVNIFMVSRLQKLSFEHAEASSKLKGKIVDSASNIETVQFSGETEFEKSYVQTFIGSQRLAHLRAWTFSEWVLVTNGILLALFMISMFVVAGSLISSDKISVGSLVMVITVVIMLEHRLFFLGQNLTEFVKRYGQVEEGLQELLEPHSITAASSAENLHVQQGKIEFKNINFAYQDSTVFSNFSLSIKAGEKVGLVGPSGAGKSTLANLLLRQYEVDSGLIAIDGCAINDVEIDSLRKAIAFVPQSTSLFHRPIMDNIRYGRLEASDEEVLEAARLAQADEFIQATKDGYNTYVGERGVKLSGGQRQRISIARAILKDAPILMLDEATSSLDSESEGAIQKALSELMRGKTVLAIAHRLSTLRAMDRLVVIEAGKIVQDGSHQELLKQGGLYAKLWNSQVSGFIQE